MLNSHQRLRYAPTRAAAAAVADSPPPAGSAAHSSTEVLTPAEAGEILRVSAKLLERWRATGDGPPFVRVTAKTIRYRRADVDAFVSARVQTSAAAS